MILKKMKIGLLVMIITSAIFTSCKKDDETPESVTPKINASYKSDGDLRPAPSAVSFTNTSTSAVSYSWDFGDGSTSVEKDPIHVYENKGEYDVVLTATDSDGKTDDYSRSIKLYGTLSEFQIDDVFIYQENFGTTLQEQNTWDSDGTGPDVTFAIYNSNGTEVFRSSNYYPDIVFSENNRATIFSEDSGLPYTCTSLSKTYTIKVYDYNYSGLALVNEFSFSANDDIIPTDSLAAYPRTFNVGDGKVAFNITWLE